MQTALFCILFVSYFCVLRSRAYFVIDLEMLTLHAYKQELNWIELLLLFLHIYILLFSVLNNNLDLC
jgi:hypothetical protein